MTTAGAANMATGLAHSAFNLVGNIGSSISASLDKSLLYEKEEQRLHIREEFIP